MSDSEPEHTASSQPAKLVANQAHRANRLSGPKVEPAEEYRIVLHLPPFWPEHPRLWFAQTEARFEIAGVTNDFTKYNYVVGHLDPQYAREVKDVIMSPPAINRYEKLKEELVRRLSATQELKLKQQLMLEELGDRKPSEFLRHLQGLAGQTVSEDFLRTIWCSQIPTSIQRILASQPHCTLEELAELADRIQDIVAPPSHVAATSAAGPSVTELAAEIAELKRAIKDLTLQLHDSRSQKRSHSRGRDARRNWSSIRSDSSYQQNPVCRYHMMHGEKAKSCIKPCDYRKGNAADR